MDGDIKMMYKESYEQLDSLEAIIEKVKKDINIARFINPDRIEAIIRASEEVINKRYEDLTDRELQEINKRIKG
jgi:hypothetical protein